MHLLLIPKRILQTLWRHKWKTLLALIVLLPVAYGAMKLATPKPPEYVTAEAARGNLTQVVEAVGTVVSDRDLDLQFKASGIVAQIYVKEGQRVKAGERLVALKAGNLGASVASAVASLHEAQAQLTALQQGARPEDVAITQATLDKSKADLQTAQASLKAAQDSLASAKVNLTKLQAEANTNLAGAVQAALNVITQKLDRSDQALQAVDSVLNNNDVQTVASFSANDAYRGIQTKSLAAKQAIATARSLPITTDEQKALDELTQVRGALSQAADVTSQAYAMVGRLPETSYFTNATRQSYQSTLADQQNAVSAAVSSLDDSVSSLRNAAASYTTKIASEQSAMVSAQGAMDKATADVQTYQTSLAINQAQLQLKTAPPRQTDLDAALARVRGAQASVALASANYGDTILTAPVDGVVTNINVKLGESTPVGPALKLLGTAPLRVEMYASEVDIPKVRLSQTGSIELDAFKGTLFPLHVSEVAPSPTDVSGVNKYKVTLDFVTVPEGVKVGMTGDVDITTGSRSDVVTVPLRAVLTDADGQKIVRVLGNGNVVEDRFVETGLEGQGSMIEVTKVQPGEKVIVLVKK